MASSRETILAKLAAATAVPTKLDRNEISEVTPYTHSGERDREACLSLLLERLRDYDAEIYETEPKDIALTLAAVVKKSGLQRFVLPLGLPGEWLMPGPEWLRDEMLTQEVIDGADGVITGASCAIADSGTIALHHGPLEGRRVLSLLPDWHLIVLKSSQVVETLPQYFARFPEPPRLVTWISGPSATADIEMTRIKGVHGPRNLNVLLVRDEAGIS